MARTNKANLSKQGEFKHGTSIGENGEILYDMPIEVKDDQDLRNYGITESDCRFLPFGSSKKVKVFFFKTPDRSFAEAEWERLNTEHSNQYFATRCMVPGKRKAFVKCRDTNKCSACPYGIKPADKQSQVISWNKLVDSGWEPVPGESVENQVLAKVEYAEIRARMDAEDPRIAQALEAKVLACESVDQIAADLGVSKPRVYQLLNRAKAIGKEYRKESSMNDQ